MSQLIVDVNEINQILPHDNAENLERVIIKGWQVCCKKGSFKVGDKAVYFVPDAVLPIELSDRLGVTKYLSKGKVKAIRLRGKPSYGFCVPLSELPEVANSNIGDNVAEQLHITKYEPPIIMTNAGLTASPHPMFPKYTDIENFGNFPSMIHDDENVIVSEKIHGTNSRCGYVENEWMAGSHNLRLQQPDDISKNAYWYPLSLSNVKEMIVGIYRDKNAKSVIVFGEICGCGIQKLTYGHKSGITFAAFDISVDGNYLDWKEYSDYCLKFNVRTVPYINSVLNIPFGQIREKLNELATGNTTFVNSQNEIGSHIREGVVIRLAKERYLATGERVILKYKNVDYVAGNFE